VQKPSAAQWLKFGNVGLKIFTTARQFCRPIHTYFRPCMTPIFPSSCTQMPWCYIKTLPNLQTTPQKSLERLKSLANLPISIR